MYYFEHMTKIHQTFRIESQTIVEAKVIAALENRSISNLYATAVREYVESRRKGKKKF
jgi:hypothetical protein